MRMFVVGSRRGGTLDERRRRGGMRGGPRSWTGEGRSGSELDAKRVFAIAVGYMVAVRGNVEVSHLGGI